MNPTPTARRLTGEIGVRWEESSFGQIDQEARRPFLTHFSCHHLRTRPFSGADYYSYQPAFFGFDRPNFGARLRFSVNDVAKMPHNGVG